MRTSSMNKHVVLQRVRTGQGHSGRNNVLSEHSVLGALQKPGLSFRSRLEASGMEVTLTLVLWRSEFEKDAYTHVLIDDIRYRITGTGAGINDLFVLLTLGRG